MISLIVFKIQYRMLCSLVETTTLKCCNIERESQDMPEKKQDAHKCQSRNEPECCWLIIPSTSA